MKDITNSLEIDTEPEQRYVGQMRNLMFFGLDLLGDVTLTKYEDSKRVWSIRSRVKGKEYLIMSDREFEEPLYRLGLLKAAERKGVEISDYFFYTIFDPMEEKLINQYMEAIKFLK